MSGPIEPIDDDEILYRRIPVSKEWYQGEKGVVYSQAFEPRPEESTGISFFRSRYRPLESAGVGKAKQGYYVASLKVGDIRAAGIDVVSRPDTSEGWDESHVEIPSLTGSTRRTDVTEEHQSKLAEIAMRNPVEGPFRTPPQ